MQSESQLKDLEEDLQEYETLQDSDSAAIEINSFEDLPRALIQARIAAGLTQKQLAEKIGVKEQQIQRYEANDYAGAALDRIQAILIALGIKLKKELFLPAGDFGPETVTRKLTDLGLDRSFVTNKLLPERLRLALAAKQDNLDTLILEAANRISRIFKIETKDFFVPTALAIDDSALAAARFKVPAGASKTRIAAYAVYSRYLAPLSLQATPYLVPSPIPVSWKAHPQADTRKVQRYEFEDHHQLLLGSRDRDWVCRVSPGREVRVHERPYRIARVAVVRWVIAEA